MANTRRKAQPAFLTTALLLCVAASPRCHAATVTFSNLIAGVTSYGFDGDGDTIADVIFSTSDPLGFNTSGPGPFQLYVTQPGLEGTSLLNPDLRVDFLHGATGSIQFGLGVSILQPRSSGPEGIVEVGLERRGKTNNCRSPR